ncbi:MAG TPA: collagen-like protein [Solirubrobacterales bacterium]|nr:collagen-like protein [Solirubrobacterales bacterium]
MQERIKKDQISGQPGRAGKDGAPGATGSPGAPGEPGASFTGKVFTYDAAGGNGNPLTFTSEDGSSLESVGPLTFHAYCEAEGEDTIRGRLEVTSDEDGVIINGEDLNQGFTRKLQELTVSGGGTKEDFLPVLRVSNEHGAFAAQAVLSVIVSVGGGCHFWGSLIVDS